MNHNVQGCQTHSLSQCSGGTTQTIYLAPILQLWQLPLASMQDLLFDPFHIQQVGFLHGCSQITRTPARSGSSRAPRLPQVSLS